MSEDETEIRPGKEPAKKIISDIRRVTRRRFCTNSSKHSFSRLSLSWFIRLFLKRCSDH